MTDNESNWELDWRAALPILLVFAGVALIVVPAFLPDRALNKGSWTQEKALQYQETGKRLHGLSHSSLHPASEADRERIHKDLEQAEKDYKAIREELDSALDRPNKLVWILRGVGVAMLAAGGIWARTMRAAA